MRHIEINKAETPLLRELNREARERSIVIVQRVAGESKVTFVGGRLAVTPNDGPRVDIGRDGTISVGGQAIHATSKRTLEENLRRALRTRSAT